MNNKLPLYSLMIAIHCHTSFGALTWYYCVYLLCKLLFPLQLDLLNELMNKLLLAVWQHQCFADEVSTAASPPCMATWTSLIDGGGLGSSSISESSSLSSSLLALDPLSPATTLKEMVLRFFSFIEPIIWGLFFLLRLSPQHLQAQLFHRSLLPLQRQLVSQPYALKACLSPTCCSAFTCRGLAAIHTTVLQLDVLSLSLRHTDQPI